VVDDNTDSAELMTELFREAGHEVVAAHDGFSALTALEDFAPEIAFLDVGLPAMDGYELAGRIAQQLGFRAPAFVSVTGYGQPSDRDRSRAAGFVRHVVKPPDPQALLDLIEEVAAERQRTPSPQADAAR
jgi:CheY-like chemotaxis protein